MSKTIRFSIPLDDEGFISLQCPFCGEMFKIQGSDFEAEDIYQLFCPNCGLVGNMKSEWLTEEVRSHALTLVENYAKGMLNGFANDLERKFNGKGCITFKRGASLKMNAPKLLIEPTDMQVMKLACCEKNIKVKFALNGIYCPYCGVK